MLDGKASIGEIRRKEVYLEDLLAINQLTDAQQAAEADAYKRSQQ